MTLRRGLSAFLSLLIASPGAAQVRPVVEAGVAAPAAAAAAAGAPAVSATLAAPLSAPVLAAPLAPSVIVPAPLAAPALAVAAAPVPSFSAAPAAAHAAVATSAAPAAALPRLTAASALPRPVAELSRGAAEPAAAPAEARDGADELDALFDGARAGRPAAADGVSPERGPSVPGPRLAPSRLRRVLRAAGLAVPAALLVSAAAVAAPHAALVGVHWLGQVSYWLANPFAFLFTMPQIHRMLARRSADVSPAMIGIGIAATAAAVLNFAFDGKDLMMYRNLAQMLGFGAMALLHRRYARAPGASPPTPRRALVEAGAIALGLTALMAAAGPLLMTAVPALPLMGALLVPLQIGSGFGFTYLMYAQLTRMRRARSAGDSSPGMMWAYLGTKSIWVWSLAMMVAIASGPARLVVPAAALFAALCWAAGGAALKRLLVARWTFLPERLTLRGRALTRERLSDFAAFAILSAVILALSGAGYLAFAGLGAIPAGAGARFAMYLLYGVQSLVACLATLMTIRLGRRLTPPRK